MHDLAQVIICSMTQPYHLSPILVFAEGRWGICDSVMFQTSMARWMITRIQSGIPRQLKGPTSHVAMSNSITICRAWTPAALSSIVGCSQRTSDTVKSQSSKSCSIRTNDRFTVVVDLKCTFSVADDKRKVEEIFHGLCKVIWVYNEFEKVDRARRFENIFNLKLLLVM